MEKRNSLIDFLKIFMIFLVVAIHYRTYIPRDLLVPFARIAIPLFFLFNGFFVGASKKDTIEKAKNNILSALKYMIFALSIFFAYDIVRALIYGQEIMPVINGFFYDNFIRDFLFYNLPKSDGHLWFVIALFATSIIHYLFCKFNKTKLYPFISVILLAVALILGQYSQLLGMGLLPSELTRNAIFTGFPFFALGFYFAKEKPAFKKSWHKYLLLVVGIVFAFLQPLENFILNGAGAWGKGRLYLSTLISATAIFVFVINTPVSVNTKWLSSRLVFNIYLFHKIVGNHMRKFVPIEARALFIFAVTFVICELAYLLLLFIKKQWKKHKNKPKSAPPLPEISENT